MKDIRESNKLIAEFMGYNIARIVDELPVDERGNYTTENGMWVLGMSLQYDTSWDWLMPVVKKCYDIDPKIDGINGPHENIVGDITWALLEVDIEETYKAVVEFINWYNQNK